MNEREPIVEIFEKADSSIKGKFRVLIGAYLETSPRGQRDLLAKKIRNTLENLEELIALDVNGAVDVQIRQVGKILGQKFPLPVPKIIGGLSFINSWLEMRIAERRG